MRAPDRSPARPVRGITLLAILMLVGFTGCMARSAVVARDDGAITNDVQARLAADAQTKPFAITVDTKAGVVRVAGAVAKDADRNAVEHIARTTPGVRAVDNYVQYGVVPVVPSVP